MTLQEVDIKLFTAVWCVAVASDKRRNGPIGTLLDDSQTTDVASSILPEAHTLQCVTFKWTIGLKCWE